MADAALQIQSEELSELRVTRPLNVLAPLIREDIRAGERAAEEAAQRASEPFFAAAGVKLWEAEAQFETWPKFYDWAIKEFGRKRVTVDSWMNYAKKVLNGGKPFKFLADGSISPANIPQPKHYPTLSSIRGDKRHTHEPSWASPVRQLVDRVSTTRMAQEKQAKVDESKLMHELAMTLIDIGYKVLAKELHPDKRGGSREAMERLNRVRQILKGAI